LTTWALIQLLGANIIEYGDTPLIIASNSGKRFKNLYKKENFEGMSRMGEVRIIIARPRKRARKITRKIQKKGILSKPSLEDSQEEEKLVCLERSMSGK